MSLALYTPLPGKQRTDALRIDTSVTAGTCSTSIFGGFNALAAGTDPHAPDDTRFALARSLDARPFGHIALTAGRWLVWAGRVDGWDEQSAGLAGLQGVGYGLHATTDKTWRSTDTTSSTIGAVLRDIIAATCPALTLGNPDQFGEPGTAATRDYYDGRDANAALGEACKQGGPDGSIWDFVVYEKQIARFAKRVLEKPGPDFVLPLEDGITVHTAIGELYGKVVVRYTNPGSSTVQYVEATYPNWMDLYSMPYLREKLVDGGTLTDAAAAAYANTLIRQIGVPVLSARIERAAGQGLRRSGGSEMPSYMLRARGWIQLGTGRGALPPLPVVATNYNWLEDTMTIDLGAPVLGIPQLLADLREIAGHVLSNTNPLTGSRR